MMLSGIFCQHVHVVYYVYKQEACSTNSKGSCICLWDRLHRNEQDGAVSEKEWLLLQALFNQISWTSLPKVFCSEEGRVKERRVISETTLSADPEVDSSPP